MNAAAVALTLLALLLVLVVLMVFFRRRSREASDERSRSTPLPEGLGSNPDADPTPPAGPDLARELTELRRRANRAGGRLPDGAVVKVNELHDVLRSTVKRVEDLPAESGHDLRGIVLEYAPGTLDAYLSLVAPDERADTAVLEQLELLLVGAREVVEASLERDRSRLDVQGRFLDAKFRRSDLDL